MRIRIEAFGFKAIDRKLMAYVDASADLTPAWLKVGNALAANNRATFERGATAWPALSEPYGAWKASRFPGRPILVRSGALYDRLTSEFDIAEVDRHSARFGTALPHALAHQYGDPARNLPARPPIAMTEDFKREVVRILQRHLHEAAKGSAGISVAA